MTLVSPVDSFRRADFFVSEAEKAYNLKQHIVACMQDYFIIQSDYEEVLINEYKRHITGS